MNQLKAVEADGGGRDEILKVLEDFGEIAAKRQK